MNPLFMTDLHIRRELSASSLEGKSFTVESFYVSHIMLIIS